MQFDFLSSNLQIAYPFQQNVTVGRFGADTELAPIVAAARIRTVDQRDENLTLRRVYLESPDGFTTFAEADIRLVWETSGEIINLSFTGGTTSAVVQLYGKWVAVEWYAPLTLSGSLDIAIKLVFPADAIEISVGDSIIQIDEAAETLTFHDSVLAQGPNKIRRVYWKRGDTLDLIADRGEEFTVQAGFNMSIGAAEAEEESNRQLTRIAIDAIPGAGLGRYLLCPGSEYVLTVNGVAANSQGELVINPLECYWPTQDLDGEITPQSEEHGITGTAQLKANEVKVVNSCAPCCSCEDYIATYEHLHALWLRAQTVSERIYDLRDQYAELVELYNSLVGSCEPIKLVLTETATEHLIVQASLCNDTAIILNNNQQTVPLLQFDLEFVLPGGVTAAYIVGSGILQAPNGSHLREPDAFTATTAVITSDLPVARRGILYWIGVWNLTGALTGKEIDVTVLATEGDLPAPRSTAASITLD